MSDFPVSLDTVIDPTANDTLAGIPHHTLHVNANAGLRKIGIGSSTPVIGTFFTATGTGTSAWGNAIGTDPGVNTAGFTTARRIAVGVSLSTTGTSTLGSAAEEAVTVHGIIPVTNAVVNYQKTGILVQVQTSDPLWAEIDTTLAGDAAASDLSVKVASVTGFRVGDSIQIDTGGSLETRIIATVGTAGALGTGLALTVALTNPHSTGVSVVRPRQQFNGPVGVDTRGIVANDNPLGQGWGTYTRGQINAALARTTLAADVSIGATTIKVASVSGFSVGDNVQIEALTSSSCEQRVITVVGTAGSGGTGIQFATPLVYTHSSGATVYEHGDGLTYGIEAAMLNNGTDQSSPGTTTSKYAYHAVAMVGHPGTAAFYINAGNPNYWHHGVYASTAVIGTAEGDNFLGYFNGTLSDYLFQVDGLGRLRLTPKTNATTPFIIKANATQSADLMQVTNSSGVLLLSISQSGVLRSDHTDQTSAAVRTRGYSNDTSGVVIAFDKSRSTTVGTLGTPVAANDQIARLLFRGDDGKTIAAAASIQAEVEGTVSSGPNTTLAAAAIVGDASVKVTSVTSFTVGSIINIGGVESRTLTAVGTSGSGGTGLQFTEPLLFAYANGAGVIQAGIVPARIVMYTAEPALGRMTKRFQINSSGVFQFNNGPTLNTGTGSPESAVSAPIGSVYLRTDGGASTTLYVKESGAGTNTGWIAK